MADLGAAALGSAVSGGFGLIGSGLNYLFNKKLAEQQNQYNIDMWKMQAEYNSPQAQMQRFSEAGLNPNLIYGQGNNGNMANAPQMVVPHAPELSKEMQKLGEAFNIENLKILVAKRKEAQANATQAQVAAADARDLREARKDFGLLYDFNANTGEFEFNSPDVEVFRPLSPEQKRLIAETGAYSNRLYYFNNMRSDYYKNLHLIPYRANFLGAQSSLLSPQIKMRNYDWQNYDKTFWIDRGKTSSPLAIPAALYHYFMEYKRTGKNPFNF